MIHQKLEQLSILGCTLSVIDGWGVVIPTILRKARWLAQDEEIQEIGRQIELSYRSYDPRLGMESTQQWRCYTNQYRLVDDGVGIYHLAYTVGSEECESPID